MKAKFSLSQRFSLLLLLPFLAVLLFSCMEAPFNHQAEVGTDHEPVMVRLVGTSESASSATRAPTSMLG